MSMLSVYEGRTDRWRLVVGDSLTVLAKLPNACIDAVVCDPPYGIDFHGEDWDGPAIRRATADQATSPAEAFERWTESWGREARRVLKPGGHLVAFGAPRTFHRLAAGLEDAGLEIRDQLLWLNTQGIPKSRRMPAGAGTQLKPAHEPITLARAPLKGTVSANRARFATGALNIDATRHGAARYWPANVVLSHSPDCAVAFVDGAPTGPSRFFYCAKATTAEREAGLDHLPLDQMSVFSGKNHPPRARRNTHVSVKPIALMRWLVRLVTPPGGIVLDPFCGSGSTGAAAVLERRPFVGIEREVAYVEIACARLEYWTRTADGSVGSPPASGRTPRLSARRQGKPNLKESAHGDQG